MLIKNIRSFRQKYPIEKNHLNVYCDLSEDWKKKLDKSFNFDQFLVPLKSKVYFYSPENNESFYITDFEPFGILKIAKQKSGLKELKEKLNYFQDEYERAQKLLNNKNFVQKAPSDLIEKEREKLSYFTEQKNKILEKIKAIQPTTIKKF